MSQRNRLGLTDLAGLRKPLVATDPVEKGSGALETAPSAVPPAVPQMVPPEVPRAVPSAVPPRILQQRKEKRPLVSQSFKLPAELDERWARVAAFNGVSKTGILLEALETFLDRLPQPSEGQGRPTKA